MIAFIKGQIIETYDKTVILLTQGGVGYEIVVPAHTFSSLPRKGEVGTFYISLVSREDALELYGFETLDEKRAFEALTGISKIGSRTAMAILSIFRPQDLRDMAQGDNFRELTRVPGIGVKTAQHIFLELKYKLGSIGSTVGSRGKSPAATPTISGDAVAALTNLGYSEDECAPIVRELLLAEPDLDVGSLIRGALKKMAKGLS